MTEKRDFSSSYDGERAASDTVFEHECDACSFEGTKTAGISFCHVCGEFLCNECTRVHRKSRATRDHDLVEDDSLHNVQCHTPTQAFEFCLKHPGKMVNFFCPTHDGVFCTDCRLISHGSCREVESISVASTGISSSKEAEKFTEQIHSMNTRTTALYKARKKSMTELEKYKQKCLREITAFRDEANKILDKMEEEMRQEILSIVLEETTKLQYDFSKMDTLRTSLEKGKTNLEAANSIGREDKIFLAMKQVGLQELMTLLDSVDQRQHIVKLDFVPHDLLQEILSSLPSLGILETTLSHPLNTVPSGLRDRSLEKVGERDVQQPDDEEVCNITGSLFLPSGESLLCDYDNAKVKLLNTDFTIQTSMKLTSGPLDVAIVTEQEVVVSLPEEEKIQYVTVPGLKPGRKVEIGRSCWGLAVHKDQIFVTCHDCPGMGAILVLTKDGAIQRIIGTTGDGSYMFTRPNYIAVDVLGEKIYVSDSDQHSVTCLTREGGPVYHCVLGKAVYPRTLVLDSDGGVLVCSKDSCTTSLQFLTPDGKPYRTLITWPLGRWNPLTFCYRSSDRTLLVGNWENNTILVYRFE